jgi:hypothetical protein
MSVALLSQPNQSGNGWDRPPVAGLADEIRRAEYRRSAIIRRLRAALSKNTLVNDRRVIDRADRVADLISEYHQLGVKILQAELL